jgi:putative transposase
MARQSGISASSSVQRIRRTFWLAAAPRRDLKLSGDPLSVTACATISALLSPPDQALLLCVSEKADAGPDRTQLHRPLSLARPKRRSHDYKCHGTTALFAALNSAGAWRLARWRRRVPSAGR